MERKRIVITGVGVVAPNGIGKEEFWNNCLAGVSGIKPITLFDTSKYRCHHAGEISNFQPEKYLGSKGLRNLDRTTLLALVAAKLAIEDAKLEITDDNRNDIGVVLGSTMGSVHSISEFDKEGLREGPRYVNPAHFPNTVINSPASQVAIRFGLRSLNTTISTGFTASLDAVGYAMDMLRLGRAKVLLVGGVEELCIQTYLGFSKLGLLAPCANGRAPAYAPLNGSADGLILGEGAALFVLETADAAASSGRPPVAELAGYGTAFRPEAIYRYDPEGVGFRQAATNALKDARLDAARVAAVSLSANAVKACDASEQHAVREIFGSRGQPQLYTEKALFGETFSADGALRVAGAIRTAAQVARVARQDVAHELVVSAGATGSASAVLVTVPAAVAESGQVITTMVSTQP